MEAALSGADLTITTAGMPRRPGMTRQELFDINAAVVKSVAEAAARVGVWVNNQTDAIMLGERRWDGRGEDQAR